MSEVSALVRLAVARCRVALLALLAVMVVGETITIGIAGLAPESFLSGLVPAGNDVVATIALMLTLFPAGFATLVMFDFGQDKELGSPQSNCSDWLLRTPVAAWKIAAVPIALKTAWGSGVWMLLVGTAALLGLELASVPRFGPCVCLSAISVWVLAIAWRPCRSGWHRLGMMSALLIPVYATFVGMVVTARSGNEVTYRLLVTTSAVLYLAGVVFAIRWTIAARSSCIGIVPESAGMWKGLAIPASRRRRLHGPISALIWHELAHSSSRLYYTFVLGVVPAIVLVTLVVTLHEGAAMMVLLLFTYLATFAASGVGDRATKDTTSSLPPYLGASPLSTAAIAWTRLAVILAIAITFYCFMLTAIGGWALWETNRAAWHRWAARCAATFGAEDGDVVWVGLRLSIAVVLGSVVFMMGLMVSFQWISMIGRTWVNSLSAMICWLTMAVVLVSLLTWFIGQTQWEETMQTIHRWLQPVPKIIIGLLALKAILTTVATVTLARSGLVARRQIGVLLVSWATITVVVAATITRLTPDPRLTFWWCLGVATLVIPLARIMILPVSLSLNRHR